MFGFLCCCCPLIWFSWLPKALALNSSWWIPLLARKLLLLLNVFRGVVLIFWLLWLFMLAPLLWTYLLELSGRT